MGYYIECDGPRGKAGWLVRAYNAEILPGVPKSVIPYNNDGKAVVCVISNGPFEAAGLCYNDEELSAFSDPRDDRPKLFLAMDQSIAHRESGYAER